MIDNELFKVPEEALKKIRTQKEFEAFNLHNLSPQIH